MPARLHHEPVAAGAPSRWLLLTHGIYGSGANLRTVARKLVEKRPDWGIELVDLRLHGRSEHGDPPHGVFACAGDLAALHFDHSIDALAGHSFGGKVVLAARDLIAVRQTWLLDSSPSARPDAMHDPDNSVAAVLAIMERLPKTWARREEFVAAVVAEGQPQALAQWLAMNLVAGTGGLTLRFDLPAVRTMLADYYAHSLWRSLENPARGEVIVVIADRSGALSADDRARLAAAPPHVAVEHVDAAHWLHAEAPDAVAALFARRLFGLGE